MARRSDTSLAALLLTQRLVDTDAAPLKASEYWRLLEVVGDPALLLGKDPEAIASDHGIDRELAGRITVLLGAASAFAVGLDDASQSGMQVVASVDEEYPERLAERLGSSAPPLLNVVGDLSLLDGDLLGVVGSRDVSPAAARSQRVPRTPRSEPVGAWSPAGPRASTAWRWELRSGGTAWLSGCWPTRSYE
jgi:predicted Rossmann fold nucleotide-binding protein DprA/Smf involved in DNA uptake